MEKQQSYTLGSTLGIYILAKIAALKIKQCYKTGKALTSTSYTRHRKWQHRYSTKFPDSGCKIWKKEVKKDNKVFDPSDLEGCTGDPWTTLELGAPTFHAVENPSIPSNL